jgi:hypothetical protein
MNGKPIYDDQSIAKVLSNIDEDYTVSVKFTHEELSDILDMLQLVKNVSSEMLTHYKDSNDNEDIAIVNSSAYRLKSSAHMIQKIYDSVNIGEADPKYIC